MEADFFRLTPYLSSIQRLDAFEEISTQIRNVDQERCEEVPVFPYPAQNIDCTGFVGYGEKCTHKCGDTVIESTCAKVMIDLGRDIIYFTIKYKQGETCSWKRQLEKTRLESLKMESST